MGPNGFRRREFRGTRSDTLISDVRTISCTREERGTMYIDLLSLTPRHANSIYLVVNPGGDDSRLWVGKFCSGHLPLFPLFSHITFSQVTRPLPAVDGTYCELTLSVSVIQPFIVFIQAMKSLPSFPDSTAPSRILVAHVMCECTFSVHYVMKNWRGRL